MGEEGVVTAIWSLNTMKTSSKNKEREIEKKSSTYFFFLLWYEFYECFMFT
jgi:hypothetical protein